MDFRLIVLLVLFASVACFMAILLILIAGVEKRYSYLRWWGASWLAGAGLYLMSGYLLFENSRTMTIVSNAWQIRLLSVFALVQPCLLFVAGVRLKQGYLSKAQLWKASLLLALTAILSASYYSSIPQISKARSDLMFTRGWAMAISATFFAYWYWRKGSDRERLFGKLSMGLLALLSVHQILLAVSVSGVPIYESLVDRVSLSVGLFLSTSLLVSFLTVVTQNMREFFAELQAVWNSESIGMALVEGNSVLRTNTTMDRLAADHVVSLSVEDVSRREITLPHGATIELTSTPLASQNQTLRLLMARDETARKAAEDRYQLAMDSVNDILFDWRCDESHIEISPRYWEVLGYPRSSLNPTHGDFMKILHPDDAPALLASFNSPFPPERDRNFEIEYRLKKRDGEYVWILARGRAVDVSPDGSPQRIVGTLSVIDERKKMQQQLADALKRAEKASEAKTQFLANMSHEMRTPLTGTLGLASLLEQTALPEDSQELVRLMKVSGSHLLRLINDVLDLTRVERGQLDLKPARLQLRQLLADAISIASAAIEGKELQIDLSVDQDVPQAIEVDGERVLQVLSHLLSNAIKFSEKGRIEVRVLMATAALQPRIRIEVADPGIGMSPDEVESIFALFVQSESELNRRYQGTGLGLALAKRLIDLLGGTIRVESTKGVGSTFAITVPFVEVDDFSFDQPKAILKEDYSHLKVLVAEDNSVNRVIACRFLSKMGIQAEIATDGIEAVAAANRTAFDLILMDLQMPHMDGIEATRRIRQESKHQPKIMALTAHAFNEDREHCLAAGMDDFLAKPLQLNTLRGVLRNFK